MAYRAEPCTCLAAAAPSATCSASARDHSQSSAPSSSRTSVSNPVRKRGDQKKPKIGSGACAYLGPKAVSVCAEKGVSAGTVLEEFLISPTFAFLCNS